MNRREFFLEKEIESWRRRAKCWEKSTVRLRLGLVWSNLMYNILLVSIFFPFFVAVSISATMYLFNPLSLPGCLLVCMPVRLCPFVCVYICMWVCMTVRLSVYLCLSICLSVSQSASLFLSRTLFFCPFLFSVYSFSLSLSHTHTHSFLLFCSYL